MKPATCHPERPSRHSNGMCDRCSSAARYANNRDRYLANKRAARAARPEIDTTLPRLLWGMAP